MPPLSRCDAMWSATSLLVLELELELGLMWSVTSLQRVEKKERASYAALVLQLRERMIGTARASEYAGHRAGAASHQTLSTVLLLLLGLASNAHEERVLFHGWPFSQGMVSGLTAR